MNTGNYIALGASAFLKMSSVVWNVQLLDISPDSWSCHPRKAWKTKGLLADTSLRSAHEKTNMIRQTLDRWRPTFHTKQLRSMINDHSGALLSFKQFHRIYSCLFLADYWCYLLISDMIILAGDKSSNLLLSKLPSLLGFCMIFKTGRTHITIFIFIQETQHRDRERDRERTVGWWTGPLLAEKIKTRATICILSSTELSFYFKSNLLSEFLLWSWSGVRGRNWWIFWCLL